MYSYAHERGFGQRLIAHTSFPSYKYLASTVVGDMVIVSIFEFKNKEDYMSFGEGMVGND